MIVLQPTALLAANTQYRFEVTNGLRDLSGAAFVAVHRDVHDGHERRRAGRRLIHRLVREGRHLRARPGRRHRVHRRGHRPRRQALRGHERRRDQALRDQCRRHAGPRAEHHARSRQPTAAFRLLIGMAFDPASTADNLDPVGRRTTSSPSTTRPSGPGKITRLSGANLEIAQDVLVGPAAIVQGPPDEQRRLRARTARCTSPRAATAPWARRTTPGACAPSASSTAPSCASIPARLPASLPLDVKTDDGGGTYDPFARERRR